MRDPVHGDILFQDFEREILDSPQIQRLRGIKQLGTAYLVYPGALHTRFDHSIGTMAISKRILSTLRAMGHDIGEEEEAIITAASLIHDVSHVPFGHTFEDERKILPDHEKSDRLKKYLSDCHLADTLTDLGLLSEVKSIMETPEPIERNHPKPWMVQIVKDAISADLLDYLRRDAHFTGLNQNYDDRLFRYFTLTDEGEHPGRILAVDLGKRGMVRQDARSEILHLLRMRYFLTERVYYHHAKQASGAMISKALEISIKYGFDPSRLRKLSDWTLLETLKNYRQGDEKAQQLVRRVELRKLYKRAFVLGPEIGTRRRNELISLYNRPGDERDELEKSLVSELNKEGISALPGDLIVHCPDLGSMKEAGVFAKDEEGMVERLDRHRRSLSRDLDGLENQYAGIWRFFVFSKPGIAREVNKVCKKAFGTEGGFSPKKYSE